MRTLALSLFSLLRRAVAAALLVLATVVVMALPAEATGVGKIRAICQALLIEKGLLGGDATNAAALGPASATDNAIARWDGTSGKLLQNSAPTIDDTGAVSWPTGLGAITHITGPSDQILKIQSGTARDLQLIAADTLSLGAGGSVRFAASTSAFHGINDNTRDIGTSSARFRTGYFGTSVVLGGTATLTGALRELEDVTAGVGAPNVLTLSESGNVLLVSSNATAEVYNTLPDAPTVGTHYTLVVMDADGGRLTANTGDTIRLSTAVSASAGNVRSTTIGSTLTVVAVSATSWVATSITGTWEVN